MFYFSDFLLALAGDTRTAIINGVRVKLTYQNGDGLSGFVVTFSSQCIKLLFPEEVMRQANSENIEPEDYINQAILSHLQ